MSRYPSMPLFAGDMLADTEHLTNEEFGCYHRLLYAMWRRNCWVPDDDRDLARICHMGIRHWRSMKPRMMQFLVRNEAGELSQKKLLKVRANLDLLSTKNRENILKRWHPELKENKEIADTRLYTKPIPNRYIARATTKTKTKDSSLEVEPSFHASGNGSEAIGPSPAIGGRSGPTPSAEARAPPPEKEWPPPSKLLHKVYPNGKSAKPANGTKHGRDRRNPRKAAAPAGAGDDHAGVAQGTPAKSEI